MRHAIVGFLILAGAIASAQMRPPYPQAPPPGYGLIDFILYITPFPEPPPPMFVLRPPFVQGANDFSVNYGEDLSVNFAVNYGQDLSTNLAVNYGQDLSTNLAVNYGQNLSVNYGVNYGQNLATPTWR